MNALTPEEIEAFLAEVEAMAWGYHMELEDAPPIEALTPVSPANVQASGLSAAVAGVPNLSLTTNPPLE